MMPKIAMLNPHAVALGSMGGRVVSERKADAARENGKKGGRPKKPKRRKAGVDDGRLE